VPEVGRPWRCSTQKASDGSWKTRNQFAHHIWGYCVDLPDALCLTEPLIVAEYRPTIFITALKSAKLSLSRE
jgi:hypothetical protein